MSSTPKARANTPLTNPNLFARARVNIYSAWTKTIQKPLFPIFLPINLSFLNTPIKKKPSLKIQSPGKSLMILIHQMHFVGPTQYNF